MGVGKARDLKKEGRWRRHLQRQAASGLSARGYCQARNLSLSGFYWWKREIAARDAEGNGRGGSAGGSPAFAEVLLSRAGVAAPEGLGGGAPSGVEVVLSDGVSIRLARGFDAETLRHAVEAVGGVG